MNESTYPQQSSTDPSVHAGPTDNMVDPNDLPEGLFDGLGDLDFLTDSERINNAEANKAYHAEFEATHEELRAQAIIDGQRMLEQCPELTEIVTGSPDYAIAAHSTDPESAEDILKSGLNIGTAGSAYGINITVQWLLRTDIASARDASTAIKENAALLASPQSHRNNSTMVIIRVPSTAPPEVYSDTLEWLETQEGRHGDVDAAVAHLIGSQDANALLEERDDYCDYLPAEYIFGFVNKSEDGNYTFTANPSAHEVQKPTAPAS